jgi:predicted O-methyltransferase YrrM
MGTSVGISASYIAAALKLNGRGKLVTLEGGAALADVARRNFAALSLEGVVEVVVGPFHETLSGAFKDSSPIDFIFIDGHHDEDATKKYFTMMLPCLAPVSVAVFDDINWSEGMKRAWHSVAAAPQCTASFSLRDLGIAVVRV